MASIIKVDTIQSTTANVFFQNSAGTEYARFDADGDLGIGTTNPLTKLHVAGSSYISGNVGIGTSATPGTNNGLVSLNVGLKGENNLNLGFESNVLGYGGQLEFRRTARTGSTRYSQIGGLEDSSGNGMLTLMTAAAGADVTERVRINPYGIGLGVVPTSGTGIMFPATQNASSDANTLDDYEEGTWTPSVTGSTSGGPFTFGTSQAYYTKIGREVKLSMFMAHNSTVTFSGAYKIGNFPFPTANYGGGGFVSYVSSWISNSPVMFQIEASTTYGYLRMKTSANPETMFDLNSGLIQNNTSYMLTILYMTTT